MADDGTLVYVDALSTALTWMNRKGVKIGSVGEPLEGFFYPALSLDGRLAAVETMENSNLDIWVYDLERGARTRLTSHPATDAPLSGRRIQSASCSLPDAAVPMCSWRPLTGVPMQNHSFPVPGMSVDQTGPRTDAVSFTRS